MKDYVFLLWYLTCRYVLVLLPDKLFFQLTNFLTHLRLGFRYHYLDLKNPRTFNEKLNYLKLLPLYFSYSHIADKVLVRDHINKTIGEKYLIPCLGIYENPEEIDFDKLPAQFILKTNHGSGWNIICRDKSTFNRKRSERLFKRWLGFNAYYLSREKQYKNIKPLIICEELLEFEIYDYKFFCFKGQPEFVQVDIDRFSDHKRAFYNMNWEKLPFSIRYEISEKNIVKPLQFDEMKSLAEELSKDISFCRIDLYIHNERVFFGEITLIPGGGNEPFLPQQYDEKIGALIDLTS
jgi:hypothetical protein